MGAPQNQPREAGSSAALGRRRFLVKAAVVGTAAWAVPMIITMEPAGAASLTSPPPTPPEVEVQGETTINPSPGASKPETKPAVEVRGALAFTGAPIATAAGIGAAAIAGGSALHHWSAHAARRGAAQADGAVQPIRTAVTRRPLSPDG